MRGIRLRGERGQTVVEFGFILTALLLMTGGLVDVGRAFYANNVVASAARNGARWGSVVGGACASGNAVSTSDFCNREGLSGASTFWSISGNTPKQGWNSYCPTPGTTPNLSYFYRASDFATSSAQETTIVGAVVNRFDSNSGSPGFLIGRAMPGFDFSRLYVCIDGTSVNTNGPPTHGDFVRVEVTYLFQPAGPLFGSAQMVLSASSQFVVE